MSNQAGKGSKRRPTDTKKFEENYEKIFGRKSFSEWAKEYGDAFPELQDDDKKYSRAEYEDLVLSLDLEGWNHD